MRGVEAGGHLGDDARGARRGRAGPSRLSARCRSVPVDVAHDQVQAPVLLARGVHGHEVGMVDRGGQARLEREARAQARVARPVGGDHLDGDGAARGRAASRGRRRPSRRGRRPPRSGSPRSPRRGRARAWGGCPSWAAEPGILAAADRPDAMDDLDRAVDTVVGRCLGVRAGEQVAVVVDEQHARARRRACATPRRRPGADAVTCVMERARRARRGAARARRGRARGRRRVHRADLEVALAHEGAQGRHRRRRARRDAAGRDRGACSRG